jgi:hypothetical protein
MLTFEITRGAVEGRPVRCTIVGAYSGAKCPGRGTVALDVVARFADARGAVPFRAYRLCPADAELFMNGYLDGNAPVELIER